MIAQTATATLIREDDTQAHIEDSLKVNAIRNGQLVEVYWNALTDDERRAAREAFLQSFEPSYY